MSKISEYLKQILSARYGKDVRQAIHDSIKDINNIATDARDSATAAAGKAVEKANEALASSQNASEKAQEAKESAEQAAAYTKQAETVSGIHIASKEIAGVIKPGENTVDADGTLVLTRKVLGSDIVATDSYAGGLKINKVFGKSVQGENPAPDNPQPIVSAGQELVDGVVSDVGISKKLTGKNLLKNTAQSQTVNGVTFTVNEDGSVTVNGTATDKTFCILTSGYLLSKGTYILSAGIFVDGTTRTQVIDANNTSKVYAMTNRTSDATFVLNEDTNVIVQVRVENGFAASNLVFKPMIRLASIEDDTYEPYTEQTLTLNRVLRGIPVTDASLANYTDADGQMWCADYVDADRGVLVQRVGYAEAKASNAWAINAGFETENTVAFYCSNTGLRENPAPHYTLTEAYVSHFLNDKELYILDKECARIGLNAFYIKVNKNRLTTLDADGFKSYLATIEPVIALYNLETPIETPLTDEEIIALHQLKTYQGVTHIFGSNDPAPTLEVEYGASRVGALSLENSNLHAVNEVLRGQMLTRSDVVDNLTSTDTDVPLSANQGKNLQNNMNNLYSIFSGIGTFYSYDPYCGWTTDILNMFTFDVAESGSYMLIGSARWYDAAETDGSGMASISMMAIDSEKTDSDPVSECYIKAYAWGTLFQVAYLESGTHFCYLRHNDITFPEMSFRFKLIRLT